MGLVVGPAVFLAVALGAGIALADMVGVTWAMAAAPILGAAAIAVKATYRRRLLATCAAFYLIGVAVWAMSADLAHRGELALRVADAPVDSLTVTGSVVDEPRKMISKSPATAMWKRKDGSAPVRWKTMLRLGGGETVAVTMTVPSGGAHPRWGEVWRATGRADAPRFPELPSYERYLFHRKVSAVMRVGPHDAERIAPSSGPVTATVQSVRRFAADSSSRFLLPDETALLVGVSLGDGSLLTEELTEDFRVTGLSHLVVASGMNVALVLGAVLVPLARLRAPRWLRAVIGVPVIVSYVVVAGAQPSVLRAGVMAALALVLWAAFHRIDLLSSIAMSALVLLMWEPFTLFDLSFQLSFMATMGLAVLMPLAEKILELPGAISKAVAIRVTGAGMVGEAAEESSEAGPPGQANDPFRYLMRSGRGLLHEGAAVALAAQMGVLPIILFNFGTLSPYSILANVAAVPVSSAVLILGLIAPLFTIAGDWAALVLYVPLHAFLAYLLWISSVFAGLPGASAAIEPLSPWSAALLTGVFFGTGIVMRRKPSAARLRRIVVPLTCLLLVVVAVYCVSGGVRSRPPARAQVTFLDVGQGDAAAIRLPSGHNVVVDTGPPGHGVVEKIRGVGISKIDLLVLTHMQLDHAGEAPAILNALPTRNVLASGQEEGPLADEVAAILTQQKLPLIRAQSGSAIALGGARLEILAPEKAPEGGEEGEAAGAELSAEDANNLSVVVRLVYGENSFLFTGDLEADGQKELLDGGAVLRSSVLKVPHHGSKDAADEGFIRAVAPLASVISVGCRNIYRHPHQDALKLLGAKDGRLFRTDKDGAVLVESDGKRLTIHAKGSGGACR